MPWRPKGDGRRAASTSQDRGYGYAWRQLAERYLATYPACGECGQPSTQADHVIPRQVLVANGVINPDDDRYLQPLCSRCHGRKSRGEGGHP